MSTIVDVSRDLTEIETLARRLHHQAIDRAGDPHMPGGDALASLAPVANLEAWEHRYEAAERWGRDTSYILDEHANWEPPLQTLCFWSEAWRAEHGHVSDKRPTIDSETKFLRWLLEWAWDNETRWDDFAADIKLARTRLENVLYDGQRAEQGIPCIYDECRGSRLTRYLKLGSVEGVKTWAFTDWRCRKCERSWPHDKYAAMITAQAELAKTEHIAGEEWCTLEAAARKVGRSPKTVETWTNRGKVAVACIVRGQRLRFVRLADVTLANQEAKRRTVHQ